jgi:hypothetical protein
MNKRVLTAVVTLLALVTLTLGAVVVYALMRPGRPAASLARLSLGATRLVVPTDYMRFDGDRGGGDLDRLDLAARFPDFAPAGRVTLRPGADIQERADATVFLSLTPGDSSLAPEDRPMKLYARFLDPAEWSHPGGLVMRRFQPGSPYDGEELYIAPPEGRAFFARCARPADKPDGLPNACISEMRANGLNLQLRFSPALLSEWERVAEGARGLMRGFAR